MTEIYRAIINEPAAWTAKSIGGRSGLTVALHDGQLDAINRLLKKTRHLAPQAVDRSQFDDPALNRFLADMLTIVKSGRGAVLITGISRDRYSEEDCERIYWGFGTHWGKAVVQSPQGDRLGHVRFTADNPKNRSYRNNKELLPHTDTNEIVGLMCLSQAASGGESQLVSSLAIHNEIFRNRPDLLPVLYEGYYYGTREHAGTDKAVTSYKMPVFCCVDGKVSCQYVSGFMPAAAERKNAKLPDGLAEATDYFEKLSTSKELSIEFTLDPGEMLIINNYTTLHSRSRYEDSETQKRHLLRLWLDVPDLRPVVSAYHQQADDYRFEVDKAKTLQPT